MDLTGLTKEEASYYSFMNYGARRKKWPEFIPWIRSFQPDKIIPWDNPKDKEADWLVRKIIYTGGC